MVDGVGERGEEGGVEFGEVGEVGGGDHEEDVV